MAIESTDTPGPLTATATASTPAEATFEIETTSRASDRFTDVLPATYDEKDDLDELRQQLNKRKRPIYAGVAFLCVVVIGVSIAVSGGDATEANTASGIETPVETTAAPIVADDSLGGVHAVDLSSSGSGWSSSSSGSGSVVIEERSIQSASNSSSGSASDSSDGPILPYKDLGFDWKNPGNWEYANGAAVSGAMVNEGGITLNPGNSPTPIRTKVSWGGEKILLIEWERSGSSDTNIWMLNEKLRPNQFVKGNGWPYWGELDIFEMFIHDKQLHPTFDFSGFAGIGNEFSYGALTMHTGKPKVNDGDTHCFCPPSHTKAMWWSNRAPMTASCSAQFSSASTKSMAVVWGSDGNGQFIELFANPTVTKGGKINGQQTYDVTPGGVTTTRIYNNNDLHWGVPMSDPCIVGAGHNAATGFPFFESFFLVLEEQNKAGDAWFKVTNVQVFKK